MTPVSTSVEIERKFLVRSFPDIPAEAKSVEIEQGYLASGPNVVEVRLRRLGERCILGIKSGGGRSRNETEIDIDPADFEEMWPYTAGCRLYKTRYYLSHGDRTIELDIYGENLTGLIVAEVEFEDLSSCENFKAPDWFGPDISDDVRYKNSKLARYGLPEGFERTTSL